MARPPSRKRKRIIQVAGATALLPSLALAGFFVLFALSIFTQQTILSAISIVSAALNTCACVAILLFTISTSNHKRTYRLCGAVPSVLAGAASACALGWMGVRHHNLPRIIFGWDSFHLLFIGFGIYVVTLVLQSIFWTMINLSQASADHESNVRKGFCRQCTKSTEGACPSPALSSSKSSLASTIRDPRHPFITQVYHSASGAASSPPEDKDQRRAAEVNHFDDWETSDVSVTERVAASLAVAEREAIEEQEAARGFVKPQKTERKATYHSTRPPSSILGSDTSVSERRNSPPLPESEISPRNGAFMIPMNAVFARQVSGYTNRRGVLLPMESIPGGTGKWLARSRAVD
ncbi:hypothetical protein BDD12DRAFT_873507 [Trichophaea hybrida]|nr:hypothetical protein BDD12DRAFT_873507 [Trichophaea hybrida]